MRKLVIFLLVIFLSSCSSNKPLNLTVTNDVLSWEMVDDADSYLVSIGSKEVQIQEASIDLLYYTEYFSLGENIIYVSVVRGESVSDSSEINHTFQFQGPRRVTIASEGFSNIILNWDAAVGAESYIVRIGDDFEASTTNTNLVVHYSSITDKSTTDVRVISVDRNGLESNHSNNIELISELSSPIAVAVKGSTSPQNSNYYVFSILEWPQVENALHYNIAVDGENFITTNTSIHIPDLDLSPGMKSYTITANILGYTSKPSNLNEFFGMIISVPETPFNVCVNGCDDESKTVVRIDKLQIVYSADSRDWHSPRLEFTYTLVNFEADNNSSGRPAIRFGIDELSGNLPNPANQQRIDVNSTESFLDTSIDGSLKLDLRWIKFGYYKLNIFNVIE